MSEDGRMTRKDFFSWDDYAHYLRESGLDPVASDGPPLGNGFHVTLHRAIHGDTPPLAPRARRRRRAVPGSAPRPNHKSVVR
jgi:hypothetical protein